MGLVSLQVTTAVLSITAKAKARAKKSETSEDKMEVVIFLLFITSNFENIRYNFPLSRKCLTEG